MSQREFLTCVVNDAYLGLMDVFRDWIIKIATDSMVRGSYKPLHVVEIYFNAQKKEKFTSDLTVLVDDLMGGRLIAHAGSLMNLANHSAFTVQILGAEKPFFKVLKTKQDSLSTDSNTFYHQVKPLGALS